MFAINPKSELLDVLKVTERKANVDVSRRARAGSRFAMWSKVLNNHCYSADFSASGHFDIGKIWLNDVASTRIGVMRCDPMTVVARPTHVRRSEEEHFLIMIPLFAKLNVVQRDRECDIEPGDLTLLSTSEPHVFTQGARDTQINTRLPADLIRERIPSVDDLTSRRFPTEQPLVRVFQAFLASLIKHGAGMSAAESELVRGSMFDLLALALTAPGAFDSEESSVRLAHRQRILRFIEMNFREPELGGTTIALSLGLSPGYIQKICSANGETLTDIIRRRRITEAQKFLRQKSFAAKSIEQISYLVGFVDPAYFSRVFRRETGMTPGEYRRLQANAVTF